MTGLYRGVRALLRALFALLFPIRVEGLEHFPATGAVMLCCNHISLRDPVLLIAVCPRMIRFMAKEELFHCKPFGWLLRHMGAFAVKRGESDLGSVRAALGVLQEGCVMGIFPQGHRDTQDQDRALKNGAAMIPLEGDGSSCACGRAIPPVPAHPRILLSAHSAGRLAKSREQPRFGRGDRTD